MRSRGIWLTMLMRGVQLNSLTALNAGTTAPISYTRFALGAVVAALRTSELKTNACSNHFC
jgi:hypothetical protein